VPIRWSALRLSEAMDMAEEHVNQATQPLEQARIVAREARKIDNLPGYADDRLARLIWEIERMERLREAIKAVRLAIPDGAIEAELESARHGSQQSLM